MATLKLQTDLALLPVALENTPTLSKVSARNAVLLAWSAFQEVYVQVAIIAQFILIDIAIVALPHVRVDISLIQASAASNAVLTVFPAQKVTIIAYNVIAIIIS